MIVLRKRLYIWLIKAYIKRWGKNIFYFFGIGLVIFFFLNMAFSYFITKLPFVEKETIGMVGPYTIDKLPAEILNKISRGLTKTTKSGMVEPDLAEKWKISPNGKAYAFYLNKNVHFSDGSSFTSKDIDYRFSDVSVSRPDKYTIVFDLKVKESYSPFLTTVSHPIFKKSFIGVGDYKVKNVKFNGNFVESIELYSERYHKAYEYQLFYPTLNSLKIAFSLGEVSKIAEASDVNFKNTSFGLFRNAVVTKKVNYGKLAVLFFNTKDKLVSSKVLREGLWHTMPDDFVQGERNASPLPYFSYVNTQGVSVYRQDLKNAKLLIDKSDTATAGGRISLTLDTLSKYEATAITIAKIWKKSNIDTKINVVDKVPLTFQIFLGEFNLSTDPDQYVLWHSDQPNNITHYDNRRIDKLLEDGRKELDIQKRISIYSDFQKYIFSDPPAAFLFFPYYYEVSRK